MHAERFLSQWVRNWAVIGHAVRATALLKAVLALLNGGKLSVTHLGRVLAGTARVKHLIKTVDRLVGNPHLHRERDGIYRALAQTLLLGNRRPVIIVDWSDFELGRQWLMLKAAVPVGGRAITLYERVYPFKRYNSPGAHREFLQALHAVLPENCRPIIVTDAGFRGPWFRAVESYGWDWVGRIRNKIKYYREETGRWCFTDSLYQQATTVVRYIGEALLSRRHQYRFQMYLVRAYQPRVGRPRRRGPKRPRTTMYRRLHRAPWLLATSLPHQPGSAKRIKKLYALRMQIEETFRDLKCHRWGFGIRYARCNSAKRLQILLLIAALAALVVWVTGLAGRAQQWARQLQANTERKRNILSTFFIGRQLLARPELILTTHAMAGAMLLLQTTISLVSA